MARGIGTKNLLPAQVEGMKVRILEMCADLATVEEMAQDIGVNRATYYNIRNRDPEFRAAVESAQYDASLAVVDKLRSVPFDEEIDVPRARVIIDGIRAWLEMRWPDRYGKRMHVTVKSVDMSGAVARARARVDAARTIEGETVATVAGVIALDSGAGGENGSGIDDLL